MIGGTYKDLEQKTKEEILEIAKKYQNDRDFSRFVEANWESAPFAVRAVLAAAILLKDRPKGNMEELYEIDARYNEHNFVVAPLVKYFDDGNNVWDGETEIEREYKGKITKYEMLAVEKKHLDYVIANNSGKKLYLTQEIIESIKELNGKKVLIKGYGFSSDEIVTGVLEISDYKFDQPNLRYNLEGYGLSSCIFMHPNGDNGRGASQIINLEDNKIIYDNPVMANKFMPFIQKVFYTYGEEAARKQYEKDYESLTTDSDNYYLDSKREEVEALNNSVEWEKRGQKLIYPEKRDDWKKCVKSRATDLYHGRDLLNALDIMELLDMGGSIESANEIADSAGHSGSSWGMMMRIVTNFSKRGPEFYRANNKKINPETEEFLQQLERENKEYEIIHPKVDKSEGMSPNKGKK